MSNIDSPATLPIGLHHTKAIISLNVTRSLMSSQIPALSLRRNIPRKHMLIVTTAQNLTTENYSFFLSLATILISVRCV